MQEQAIKEVEQIEQAITRLLEQMDQAAQKAADEVRKQLEGK